MVICNHLLKTHIEMFSFNGNINSSIILLLEVLELKAQIMMIIIKSKGFYTTSIRSLNTKMDKYLISITILVARTKIAYSNCKRYYKYNH